MFGEVVSNAVEMLILLFWIGSTFTMVWAAVWGRADRKKWRSYGISLLLIPFLPEKCVLTQYA
jgi:hypothetical protein